MEVSPITKYVNKEDDLKYLDGDIVRGSKFSGNLYMTGVPISVKITGSSETNDLIEAENKKNHNRRQIFTGWRISDKSWYELTVTHGEYEWKLRKTIADITSLHNSLVNRLRVRSILLFGKGTPIELDHFPTKVEIFMGQMMGEPKKLMENYLQSILNSEIVRDAECVIKFFEISPLSFDKRLGFSKRKEDLINKIPSHTLLPICCLVGIFKQPRWLVLKDTYLIYMTRKVHRMTKELNINEFEVDPKTLALSYPGQTKRNWRLCKVILMDRNFAFKPQYEKLMRINFLKLYNTHGRLVTICQSTTKMMEWSEAIAAVLQKNGPARDYVDINRFGSFAPPRPNTHATVFIDGAYYMEAVARAIAQAQHEIFITDWCMNPEVFLRRPIKTNAWRLDKLLQAKAQQGVRICVILYAGVEKVVPFISAKTAWHLQSLHPNIHVYLSPLIKWFWSHHEKMVAIDQSIVFMGGIDLCFGRWDTVDHKIEDVFKSSPNAGRVTQPSQIFDVKPLPPIKKRKPSVMHEFQIEEVHRSHEPSSHPTVSTRERKMSQRRWSQGERRLSSTWHMPKPFKRNQPILVDLRARESVKPSQLNKRFLGIFNRAGVALKGAFTRRPSTAQTMTMRRESTQNDDSLMFLESQWGGDQRGEPYGFDNLAFEDDEGVVVDQSFMDDLEHLCEIGQRCTWVGQDYVNWNVCETDGKEHPAKELLDRQSVPRMPWHDVACVVSGQVAFDLSRHFIQRWNAIRNSRIRLSTKGTSEREKRRRRPLLIPTPPCSPWTENHLNSVLRDPRQAAVCQVQALRSVSNWSLCVPAGNSKRGFRDEFQRWLQGDPRTNSAANTEEIGLETSILSAYVNMILDAERFILIENQFFISYILSSDYDTLMKADAPLSCKNEKSCDPHARLPNATQTMQVKNRIVDAIFLRIVRAYKEGKPFRVFIILPLVPGFVGEFGSPSSRSQNMIWHYTRLSLFIGEQALIPRLEQLVPNPYDYVSVCGLRTYDEWPNGNLKTELVYVHSKVMVVDDRRMILGSANLNDRSTRGKRDSELAVVIENNPRYAAQEFCPFVRRFRRSLMAEHLGVLPTLERFNPENELSDELLNDPVCDKFYNDIWKATADQNAEIFEKVFNVIPSNKLKTFNDCKEYRRKVPLSIGDPQGSREMLNRIRGTLVTFPSEFLVNEDLTPPPGTLEKLAPASIWI